MRRAEHGEEDQARRVGEAREDQLVVVEGADKGEASNQLLGDKYERFGTYIMAHQGISRRASSAKEPRNEEGDDSIVRNGGVSGPVGRRRGYVSKSFLDYHDNGEERADNRIEHAY